MNKSRSLLMAAFLLNAQIYAGIIKPEEAFWRTHSLWRNCQDRVIMM